MTILTQLVWGSVLLLICSAVQIVLLVAAVRVMLHVLAGFALPLRWHQGAIIMGLGFTAVVVTHTFQVWLWTVALLWLGAIGDFSTAVYFALATYTTLGYGDVTVDEPFRMFAAMAAVTGMLNFGLSAAFLVGIFSRLMPAMDKRG